MCIDGSAETVGGVGSVSDIGAVGAVVGVGVSAVGLVGVGVGDVDAGGVCGVGVGGVSPAQLKSEDIVGCLLSFPTPLPPHFALQNTLHYISSHIFTFATQLYHRATVHNILSFPSQ